MPIFDKSKRYKNKKGQVFGKGVWLDDSGKLLPPGFGYEVNRDSKAISQLNSDGTITKFPYEKWAKKKASQAELQVLKNDRKYGIPVIPEKMMTISIDKSSPTRKNAGATFPENMLDSIAVNAKKAGLPFSTALGIVAKESTFGLGQRSAGHSMLPWDRLINQKGNDLNKEARAISYSGVYSPSLLVSNWKQRNETPFHDYFYDEQGQLLTAPKSDTFYDADINASRKKANNYSFQEASPLYKAFKDYATDPYGYNHNDKSYTTKVKANTNELVNFSPEIRTYMQKNNLNADGGFLQPRDAWDALSLPEKAEMIKVAVNNGIFNLSDIRQKYNEFAEGGKMNSDEKYYSQMEEVADENYKDWGFGSPDEALVHALNDNTYDYRGYYANNPQQDANANTHWPDTYKTVYHPTFSDESVHSGQRSQYNPSGLPGGFWVGDVFVPRAWQVDANKYSVSGPLVEAVMNEYKSGGGIHIKPSHRGRLTELKKRTGKTEAELYRTGSAATKKMITFARNARKWKHDLGGNLVLDSYGNTYGGGGLFGNETVDTVASFLPILGTAEDAYEFYDEPTLANAGWLALSLGSDIITGGMAGRAIKALRMANKANDAAKAASRAARTTWEAGKRANAVSSGSVRGADMRRMINSVKAAGATRQAAIRRANDALIDAGIKVGVDQGFNTFLNATQNDMLPTFGLQQEQKHGLGGNLFYPGGNITYGQPYYSYDENGQRELDKTGNPIINYNALLSNIVVSPQKKEIDHSIYTDRRSDTTTRGFHEGITPFGAGKRQAGEFPFFTLIDAFDRETNMSRSDSPIYKPDLITGEPLLPSFGKIASPSVTERLLKWQGRPLTQMPKNSLASAQRLRIKGLNYEQQAELLQQDAIFRRAGVDMSKLSLDDLLNAYDKREELLRLGRPERFSIVRPAGVNGFTVYDNIANKDDIRRIGVVNLYGDSDNNLHMGNINNITRLNDDKIGGVQERGLSAAINIAKSIGGKGVITGEQYQNAPLQLHVLDKFPNKTPLWGHGNYSNVKAVEDYYHSKPLFIGEKYVDDVDEMRTASPDIYTYLTDPNTPAFLIEESPFFVPTKSSVFDPTRLTEEGKMNIDWDNYFVFNKGGRLFKK